ncbi:MAG: transposase [Candidatus Omnitrophica bacterium]|nr:transposase [Candidatus Omnitrophota bacterium]
MRKVEGVPLSRERIIYPNAVYHITHRAPGREMLFLEDSDYLYMLSLLKSIPQKFNWKIFSFCLMPNHLHLLVRIKDENLSLGAKYLFEKYAKYLNAKYSRKGPVFCKPFRASLCLNEKYLLAISLYIHLNPFKARLITELGKYRWSSLNLFVGRISRQSFVDSDFILNMLNDNTDKGKEIYITLINDAINIRLNAISQDLNALNKFRLEFAYYMKSKDKVDNVDEDTLKLCDEIERSKKIKRFTRPEDVAAIKYLGEQLLSNGYTISEIAKMLNKSRQLISRKLIK